MNKNDELVVLCSRAFLACFLSLSACGGSGSATPGAADAGDGNTQADASQATANDGAAVDARGSSTSGSASSSTGSASSSGVSSTTSSSGASASTPTCTPVTSYAVPSTCACFGPSSCPVDGGKASMDCLYMEAPLTANGNPTCRGCANNSFPNACHLCKETFNCACLAPYLQDAGSTQQCCDSSGGPYLSEYACP